jgi:hypothetical protein
MAANFAKLPELPRRAANEKAPPGLTQAGQTVHRGHCPPKPQEGKRDKTRNQ